MTIPLKATVAGAITALLLATPGLANAAPTPDPEPNATVTATASPTPTSQASTGEPQPTAGAEQTEPAPTEPAATESAPTEEPAPQQRARVAEEPTVAEEPEVAEAPAPAATYRAPIEAVYQAHRGVLGEALSVEFPGQNNTTVVRFAGGVIIMNNETNRAYAVYGAIYATYGSLGWEGGVLGRPTSSEEAGGVAGSRITRFENGIIVWSPSTGARAVYGAILATYRALGAESGVLGLPTSSEFTAGRGARAVNFQRGVILWTPATGANPVYGAIFSTYRAHGFERGVLGLPRTPEFTGARGARVQNYENGQIIWSPSTGAHAVYGSIGAAYASLGWEGGVMGLPTTSEFAGRGGARVNRFQNGIIIWKATTGAFGVRGAILGEYARQGYEGGTLGAPIGDETPVDGGWTQDFERGRISLVNGRFSIVRPGPSVDARCRTGRVLCISKSDRKLRWMIDGQVIREFDARFGSTATPTREGSFTVFRKVRNEWSYIYNVPMPFSMYFSGGQAVHYSADFAARGYSGASGGCVNIRDYAGIQWLYDTQVRVGDRVVVYW
ncbi:L,D-transpeptidase family protein [Granulicoccus sp. GXG6511]|uniref:L,D-transpeptidase family protein n=1 Tax=Granulicoccus sp. GXG6511 TaxID=3381351 RepID=UPI003D7CB55E